MNLCFEALSTISINTLFLYNLSSEFVKYKLNWNLWSLSKNYTNTYIFINYNKMITYHYHWPKPKTNKMSCEPIIKYDIIYL